MTSILSWVGFTLVVLVALVLDLVFTGGKGRALSHREAGRRVLGWAALSLGVGAALWKVRGADAGLQFLGCYLVEYALSVDNLFVFLVLFDAFRVEPAHRRLLLSWGVFGAIIFRAALLLSGAALVRRFAWLLLPCGAFLIFSAAKLLWSAPEVAPKENALVRLARRLLPISEATTPQAFALLVKEDGRWRFTSLFLVLVMVETTDLVFAFDSIPAVLGISQDAFIVYSSNVCAILGLRSLFFLLDGLMARLSYFKQTLAAVLGFVGVRMLLGPWVHLPLWLTLLVIAALLATAVGASLLRPPRPQP